MKTKEKIEKCLELYDNPLDVPRLRLFVSKNKRIKPWVWEVAVIYAINDKSWRDQFWVSNEMADYLSFDNLCGQISQELDYIIGLKVKD